MARRNAERLGLADRVRFHQGTLPAGPERFELIVANLPYVAQPDWEGLPPEVREWEPREALLAGADGLDAYRAFVPECFLYLSRYAIQTKEALAVEVGEGQAPAVAALMREAGLGSVEMRRDLAGIERVVVGER